jgi:hypothetical protein
VRERPPNPTKTEKKDPKAKLLLPFGVLPGLDRLSLSISRTYLILVRVFFFLNLYFTPFSSLRALILNEAVKDRPLLGIAC